MVDTTVEGPNRLEAFNKRLAAGREPVPGEPYSALEALQALENAYGTDAVTPRMREIAQRIHDAEVADARLATQG